MSFSSKDNKTDFIESYFRLQEIIEFTLAQLRQETENNEVEIGVMQSGADNLAQKLPDIEDLVNMASVIS